MTIDSHVDCLVFSKNRPAQLALLLESVNKHARDVFRTLTVLYTYTGTHDTYKGYALGYQYAKQDARMTVGVPIAEPLVWLPEHDFDADVRSWLDAHGPHVAFLVDDDVFYAPAPQPGALPFSYRAGDYDYPLSVDGVVYDKAAVLERLDFRFADPTQLEAGLHVRRGDLAIADWHPCLTGVPANIVSDSSNNPSMGIAPEQLNERYLAGERLSLHAIAPELVTGAHTELTYEWTRP